MVKCFDGQLVLSGRNELYSDTDFYGHSSVDGLLEIAHAPADCIVAQEFPCYDSGQTCLHQRLWFV